MGERLGLSFAALILVGLGGILIGRGLVEELGAGHAGDRPEEPRVALAVWVLPPGREQVAMRLLRPVLDAGVSGRPVSNVQIVGTEVRLLLEGGGALRLRARGDEHPVAVVLFEGVAEDELARRALEAASLTELFVQVRPAPIDVEPTPEPEVSASLLDPAARSTGLPAYLLLVLGLLLGGLASVLGSRFVAAERIESRRAPDPSPSGWLFGIVLVAVGLRVALTSVLPAETDEVLPLTSGLGLLSGSHDAWLHPPLFRALGVTWVELIGWRAGDPTWQLRVPTLLASTIGLLFLTAAVARLGRAHMHGFFALSAVLVGPALVGATVLARPYGVLFMLGGIVAYAVAEPAPSRLRSSVALIAAGSSCWVDLSGGLLLVLLVLSWSARDWRRLLVAGLALTLFAAPLIPGALTALLHPVLDPHLSASVSMAQSPESGLARGGLWSLCGRLSSFTVLGVAVSKLGLTASGVLLFAGYRVRKTRPDLVLALGLAVLFAIGLALMRAVRPRNLVLLPLLFALVGAGALRAPGARRHGAD